MKKLNLSIYLSLSLLVTSCANDITPTKEPVTTQTGEVAGENWEAWKLSFYKVGLAKGVSKPIMQSFLDNVTFYPKAIKRDKSQSEFKKFIWQYLDGAVSQTRITKGREKFNANSELLARIGKQIGVAPQYVVAIWGVESNYGSYTGKVPLISAMATLAFEGRRKQFFENQLLTTLKLVEAGDIPTINAKGSWAGGMGHTQFIPTSYVSYAVDFDGDGKRDLWNHNDALASTANYFIKKGWQKGLPWGKEVSLPADFDYLYANNRKDFKSLNAWQSLGVKSVNGGDLPNSEVVARLFVPAGASGPKILLYKNFDVIKRYNNSDSYALAVSLLADKIAGKTPLQTPWPRTQAKKVTKDDVYLIQNKLNEKGFDAGVADGKFGNNTKRAIQFFQQSKGLITDGFLTKSLFDIIVE